MMATRSTRCTSSKSLPETIRLMSSRSEMSSAWARVFRLMISSPWSVSGSLGCRSNSSVQPRMALSGVRSSCETIARKSSLTRLARSASVRAVALGFQEPLAIEFGGATLALGDPALGHVAEDEHRTDDPPLPVADRRSAVVDGMLAAIAADQHGVVGESNHHAFVQNATHGVFDLLAAGFVEDAKHFFAIAALGVGCAPPSQMFRDWIHEDDLAMHVGRDHGIADAFESAFRTTLVARRSPPRRGVVG
jgi:hypothetical protein